MALTITLVATSLLAVAVKGFNVIPNPGTYYPNPGRLAQIPFPPPVPAPVPPYAPGYPYLPAPELKEIDFIYPPSPPRYQEVDIFIPQPPPPSVIEETFEYRPRYPFPTPSGLWPSRANSGPVIVEEFLDDNLDDPRQFNSFQISTTSTGNGGLTLVTNNDNGKTQTFLTPTNRRGQFYRMPSTRSLVANRFLRAFDLANGGDIRDLRASRQALDLANGFEIRDYIVPRQALDLANGGDFRDYRVPRPALDFANGDDFRDYRVPRYRQSRPFY